MKIFRDSVSKVLLTRSNVTSARRHSIRSFSALTTGSPSISTYASSTVPNLLLAAGGILCIAGASIQTPAVTHNHCQVPCGIFDDPATVQELREACTTVRKAIVQSNSLHATISTDPLALNQIVRWINTKEEHCSKIIELVGSYCLCQRVKRVNFESESDYLEALKVHHRVMQAAMKAKQSMNEEACAALEHAVEDLSKMYTK